MLVWILSLFVYIRTDNLDDVMSGTIPLAWFWTHMVDALYGFTAVTNLMIFIIYAIVDAVELVGFFMISSGASGNFLVFWAKNVGQWVSMVLKIGPWVFALVSAFHIQAGNKGATNAGFLTGITLFSWLFGIAAHLASVTRLEYYNHALNI